MNIAEAFTEPVFSGHSLEDSSKPLLSDEAAEQFSIQVADNLGAVEALRPTWLNWTHSLNTDPDYYLHGLSSDPTIVNPYVITIAQEGVPQAMLLGHVRESRVSTVVASVSIDGPRARVLEVTAGGRMGIDSKAVDRRLAIQLRDALRTTSVDLLCFQRLPLQSDLFRELQKMPGLLMKPSVPHVFHYSVVSLASAPGKRPRALSGKNAREVRRKTRILQRAFPDQIRFHCFSEPDELELGLRDACAVDVATWQHDLGYRGLNTQAGREKLAFCASQAWLRIYVMYVGESPVAFLIGQHYKQTFYCQYAGYHHDFAGYSVGSLLTAWVLERLSALGVQQVDLGEGGQEHNRRLGCHVHEEGTVHLYAPTWRGLRVGAFFGASKAVRTMGRNTRESLHLDRASRLWERLSQSHPPPSELGSKISALPQDPRFDGLTGMAKAHGPSWHVAGDD